MLLLGNLGPRTNGRRYERSRIDSLQKAEAGGRQEGAPPPVVGFPKGGDGAPHIQERRNQMTIIHFGVLHIRNRRTSDHREGDSRNPQNRHSPHMNHECRIGLGLSD